MLQLRFHGRGGQGAVTSAELLALAAISEGKFAQAFPSFGPERRGAPVMAFARVSDKQIRNRTKVYNPDIVIVLDASILKTVNVLDGTHKDSIILISTSKQGDEVRKMLKTELTVYTVDAKKIALAEMKVPITNTTMLGAVLGIKDIIKIESLEEMIRQRFGKIADGNIRSFKRAMKEIKPV